MNEIVQKTEREHLRQGRLGMYLGASAENHESSPESLQVAIREVVDNSKDVLIDSGKGKSIWFYVDKDKEPLGLKEYEGKSNEFCKAWYRYTVADDSVGFPINAMTPNNGITVTAMQAAMENFRTGNKMDNKTADIVGLNGIGAAATNFSSAIFVVYSRLSLQKLSQTTDEVKELLKKAKIKQSNCDDYFLRIEWHLGIRQSISIVKKSDDAILMKYFAKTSPSTITTFIPDPTIHGTTECAINDGMFKYLNYIYPDYTFYLNGKKVKADIGFKYSGKVQINQDETTTTAFASRDVLNPYIKCTYSVGVSKDFNKDTKLYSVNTLDCQQGKHVRIFEAAWTKAFCDVFDDDSISKYATMGIDALFILQCHETEFRSQTKVDLIKIPNFETAKPLPKLVKEFTKLIEAHKDEFKVAYDRIKEFHNAKQNIGKLKELKQRIGDMASGKSKSVSSYMPKKLLDCPCKDRSRAEVFYVEGDSAAGGFVKARAGLDNIAVMPLRGKVLNTADIPVNKAMENAEIYDITNISGGVDDLHLDVKKLHFSKFIIATDADSDGLQIGALLLCDLVKNHSFLFGTAENDYKDSMVYYAQAPLFAFTQVDGTKKDVFFYAGQEADVAEFQKKHKYKAAKRFKGLGELQPNELREFYLDPSTRKLLQFTLDDAKDFLSLMSTETKDKNVLMESAGIITRQCIQL